MLPLDDIVMKDGDGLSQVITQVRHQRARLRETADVDSLTVVRLKNRAMLLKHEAEQLYAWALKLEEEYLWDRARRLIKAQGEIEQTQRMLGHLLTALQQWEQGEGDRETLDGLFRRLIRFIEAWEAAL